MLQVLIYLYSILKVVLTIISFPFLKLLRKKFYNEFHLGKLEGEKWQGIYCSVCHKLEFST